MGDCNSIHVRASTRKVGDHIRLVFLPDRQLKLMKAQKLCVKVNLDRAAHKRPCVEMAPTFFFFFFKQYCTLPSVCYSPPKEMRQSYVAIYLWIFFHLIRNVQKKTNGQVKNNVTSL